jgi:hypothetical protein
LGLGGGGKGGAVRFEQEHDCGHKAKALVDFGGFLALAIKAPARAVAVG